MTPSRLIGLGVFVVTGIFLFSLALFLIGERRMLFKDSFEVYTEFSKVTGLMDGAKVRVSGKDAGEVLAIENPPGPSSKFRCRLRITEDLHPLVRTDSIVTIQTDGLVGNKFLQVSAGSENKPKAPVKSTIPSREPFEMADLLEQARDTVNMMNQTVANIRDDLEKTIKVAGQTVEQANVLITDAGADVRSMTASGTRIASDLSEIVNGARAGRGSLGKLINDDHLYNSAAEIAEKANVTMENVRIASEKARQAVSDFQKRDKSGNNLSADLRVTLNKAKEAMSDMAENMEALKHNFFFRGFFKKRGYYDLDELTLVDYRRGALETKERASKRVWLHASEIFESENGIEKLSEVGKKKVDAAMAQFLEYPINSLLMVEGYSATGTRDQEFLCSRARAVAVQEYLLKTFHLDPDSVGFMPMGEAKGEASSQEKWEGVSLVLFYDKSAEAPVR
jgi:phospholipid/cholesterol/gamma-HCH transport system substrate-binding protein